MLKIDYRTDTAAAVTVVVDFFKARFNLLRLARECGDATELRRAAADRTPS
jgi:hypothetical protein